MPLTRYDQFLDAAERHGLWPDAGKLHHYLQYLFRDIPHPSSVLDIGGGSGLLSYYVASRGAEDVVCVEPVAEGSYGTVERTFHALGEELQLADRVHFAPVPFQEFNPDGRQFDLLISYNSINHLNEDDCMLLHQDSDAYDRYLEQLVRMREMTAPGGRLLIADASRHNLLGSAGLPNPLHSTVEWEKHQAPEFWRKMLLEAGFEGGRIRWGYPRRMGRWGQRLFTGPVSAALYSHFILDMRRPA